MGKTKTGEGSWGNSDTRPSFFQIMLSKNLYELKIPTEFFDNHLASEENERVILKGPCGSWDAKVERRDGDDGGCVYLVKGWPEFVESHSLRRAEFVVFLYSGGMSFDVSIYGSNGLLKTMRRKLLMLLFSPRLTLSSDMR
ncbi:hypothetical protein OROGR_012534 [Orobanche gracilis]